MPTLHISRIRLIALKTFKILHKLTPVYLQDLVSYKKILHILSGMRTLLISRGYALPSTVNPPSVMRQLQCRTASLMKCVRLRTLLSSRGWSTLGVVLHAIFYV